jgi:hypothetical protein
MASRVPQAYCDALNAKDVEAVGEREEIMAFYRETFSQRPSLGASVGRVVENGKLIAFEVIVHDSPTAPHGQANALDFAQLDADDRMTSKHVFYSPDRSN